MKKGFLKKLVSGVLTGFLCLTSVPNIPDLDASAASDYQKTFTQNGYDYEVWNQYSQGTISFDAGSGPGTYSCSWSGIHNILFRAGKKWSSGTQWNQLDGIKVDYACDYHPNGNSYLCVYGWTTSPLVEYYIVDSYGSWRPPGESANMKKVGTITVDDGTYEVYSGTHDGPSIEQGVTHFNQYWSVRVDSQLRTQGTINIDKHFAAWENQFNMKMGSLREVALNVEGWQSSGRATVSKNELTIGGGTEPDVPKEPKEANADGSYFKSTFESGTDEWTGRGSAKVTTDSKNYYSGSKSLYVSGREDNWHGAAITLDPDYFVPGYTYSFSTAVLQKSGEPVDMKFTLQQGSGDSATYNEVASGTAKSGEWTKLENVSFTIPTGSSELVLYVEAPESLTDFYIDDVLAAVEKTKSSVVTGGGTVEGGSNISTTTTTTITDGPYNVTTTTTYDNKNAGLKNVFSDYFRVGSAVSQNEVGKASDFILKHFNSITPENELKPENILDQSASQSKGNNVNPQVKLPYGAKVILDWAVKNNMPVRGHTLVWHSQTPGWFFRENFSDSGAIVSKEIMDQRMENFIKNTFAMLKENYPTLNLYAYDVVNEAFEVNNGSLRSAGMDQANGQSPWTLIYGDDSYMVKAFEYARRYAPEGCKLFYNDFNEYIDSKRDSIYSFCKKVYEQGNLDGVGMQSHLDTTYPSASLYKQALEKFASIGCEIHVTELDATAKASNGATEASQATYYEGIVKAIRDCDAVTSLTFWGTNDTMSWRSGDKPLIFDGSYQPKQAYDKIVALVDPSEWGPGYTDEGSSNEKDIDKLVTLWGDADNDGEVKMNDVVLVMQAIANSDVYGENGSSKDRIKSPGIYNADVYEAGGGLSTMDALHIQKFLLELETLPYSYDASQKKTTSGGSTTTTTTTTAVINTDGFFTASFESGSDDWEGRGAASVSTDKENYYSGSSSLKISGRTDNWHGASINLDSATFKAGNTYSFSAAVMQPTASAQDMKMTLQYTLDGDEKYSEVASVSAASKTWTKLENASYTIPAGASNLVLYIEMPDSLTNFYIDDVVAAEEGKKSAVVNGQGKVGEFPASQVDTSKKLVAISFDDGAVGSAATDPSMRIINAIANEGWHATFFYVGSWISGSSDEQEVKYAYSKGMEIANHSTTHPKLSTKSASEIRSEFDQTHAKLKSIIGAEPSKMMRLPYLDYNSTVTSTLNDVALISCGVDSGDWQNGATKQSVVNAITTAMNNGSLENSIVLCHETYGHTADAIEELIPVLKANGYQIVTVSELFEARGQQLKGGTVYTRCQ
ncbi:MAG: endo-1,4-beta-xylanase [Ruminococcus sp.]|nr:endo-1,4-beta-xylanase [Ruminococcus sp.]